MKTRSTNDSALKTTGLPPSPTTRSPAVHTMNNAAEELAPTLARQSNTRREFEQGRSKIGEIKPAPLPPKQSTVPLKAAPHIGAGTEAEAEAPSEDENEPKMKKAKEDLEEVEEDLEEVEENLEVVKSRMNGAYTTLFAAQEELRLFRLETANPIAKRLLDQIEKTGTAKINPNDKAAPAMQQLTNSTLTKRDIIRTSQSLNLNHSESGGDFGFYKRGTEKTVNERGETVYLSDHLVNKAKWEHLKEKDIGLPRYNKEMSHNILERMPVYAELFPDFLTCGEDYFQIAEQPESWKKDKPLVDLVGQLFGFPNWRGMIAQVCDYRSELGGMSSVRFIDDDIVPWRNEMPECFKKAGYIFTFKDGNTTRFNVHGQLSDLPAKNKPSQEQFLDKHCVDVFSVEKLDDNGARDETFGIKGIKRFRRYKDVRLEIGGTFWRKNGGKGIPLKKTHMPSVVGGEGKRFETQKGTFMVTRLI